MAKITFMGAGSTVFARNVLGDCMCSPALCDSEIALYDIDAQRLEDSQVILNAINQNVNQGRAEIKAYLGEENRKEALRGADFVVNAIQVGGYDPCTITDFEIPKKYGLRQTIADTGNRRNHAGTEDDPGAGRFRQRYRRSLSGRLVLKLYQPHGDSFRLYGKIYRGENCRPVP